MSLGRSEAFAAEPYKSCHMGRVLALFHRPVFFGTPCDDALPSQDKDMKPNWSGHAPTGVSLLQRGPGPYPWRFFTIPKRVAKAAASSRDLTWSLVRMF
jgi:hypothetical protein